MTKQDYDAYSRNCLRECENDFPFLAGGYTQADWNIINGALIDIEYLDDYCDPLSELEYVTHVTKPYWA